MKKLDSREFKELQSLLSKQKKGKLSGGEEARLSELTAKRNEKMSNDIKWWSNYPELVKNVTNLAFNYIPGTPTVLEYLPFSFGNLAICHTRFSVGLSRTSADAFNAQMRQLWLDMHRKYRGIGGYQRSDLGIAIIAIINLYATLAKFERIYAVMNTYKIMNRSVPYALVEGLHIGKSMFNDLASLRYELNNRIVRMQQLCLPRGIAAVESELTNSIGIFKDSENPRASLFCFDAVDFGVYDPTALSSGGCVKFENFNVNHMNDTTPAGLSGFSLGDMTTILDTQLNALLGDDDIAKMCSDLIAAYGPENVLTIGYISENMTIEPVHDYERLLQFHNASILGETATKFDSNLTLTQVQALATAGQYNVIYQYDDIIRDERVCIGDGSLSGSIVSSGGYYYRGATASYNGKAKIGDRIFDTWVDNPGDMEILCGTRFTVNCSQVQTVSSGGTTLYFQQIMACGLSLITDITVVYFNSANQSYDAINLWYQFFDDSALPIDQHLYLTHFDWAPILYVEETSDTSTNTVLGDIDNFTILSIQSLDAIHTAAIYSAFKIPNVTYIN